MDTGQTHMRDKTTLRLANKGKQYERQPGRDRRDGQVRTDIFGGKHNEGNTGVAGRRKRGGRETRW